MAEIVVFRKGIAAMDGFTCARHDRRCESAASVRFVKKKIAQRFKIKDVGIVKHLLGMEIKYDLVKREMHISQEQYILQTAAQFNQRMPERLRTRASQD